jgi:aminopeptidase
MKKSILRKYANLLVCKGINVQPGQYVEILASLDQPEFVQMCVEEAYKRKAALVQVRWSYQPIKKIVVNKTKEKILSQYDSETEIIWRNRRDRLSCMLYILSDDPDGLKGINQEKLQSSTQAMMKYVKPIRNEMENKYQWCIAAVPSVAWARKIFPSETKTQAVNKLWDAILYASRVTLDPIKAWEDHNADLKKRCDYLNSLNLEYLHYTSKSNGTNLRVGMHPEALWCGGSEFALGSNIEFNPNIPSEECFTSPLKGKAEGIVHSAKPLSYNGEIIDNFWIEFKDGKASNWHAEVNNDLLTKIITMDEGAAYLGETALIPFDSPISNSGLLFYNTLFDENASCHLAIGHGFTNVIKDYEKFTQKELIDKGINDSITHVDFMIGTKDFEIVGHTRDGKDVQIFKNGNWAF